MHLYHSGSSSFNLCAVTLFLCQYPPTMNKLLRFGPIASLNFVFAGSVVGQKAQSKVKIYCSLFCSFLNFAFLLGVYSVTRMNLFSTKYE